MNYRGAGTYRHYKGGVYEVAGLALHESELFSLVVYRPAAGEASGARPADSEVEYWARPLDDFNASVRAGGPPGAAVPRFTKVDPQAEEQGSD